MFRGAFVFIALLAACNSGTRRIEPAGPKLGTETDPDGPHRAAVAAQVTPYIDADIVSGVVVGLFDVGKIEIYGFGHGPGGKPPDGHTLFEIGSVTKSYTSLLFADAIQRREVELDTPLADLLPPGVTAPTKDKVAITLRHLALHSSGLPRLPPSFTTTSTDPYARYTEEALYRDLVQTELAITPGTQVAYSNFGAGVLGFTLGKKLGKGYQAMLAERVLAPLGLTETFFVTPPALAAHRTTGTNDDLTAVPAWNFAALAAAGGLISSVRDQLKLVDAELDAAAGTTQAPLRRAMKLTQEPQLETSGENEGLGWQIDKSGRYWHNGGTGGFHAFVGFDPKTKRGIVVLASTSTTMIDHLADTLYDVLDGTAKDPVKFPTSAQLTP
ncbi:MAG: beta-lactamase family protein, partial [Deltaproteobacteria bacterium]|nr:beta-lactamase family protein [Deltaproteobacteria bacterium]